MRSCTLVRLLTLALLVVECIATVSWVAGESGSWHDAVHWSTGSIPDHSSIVSINITSNQYITINSSVTVGQLSFVGGVLELADNCTLSIGNRFELHRGILKSADEAVTPARVVLDGDSVFLGPGRKQLRDLSVYQKSGQLHWSQGDLVFWKASLIVDEDALISIESNATNALRVLSDYSRSMFDYYPSSTLNPQINLQNVYAPSEAIYDIISENAVRVTTSVGATGTEIYDLGVSQDIAAAEFYAQHVPNLQFGYKYNLYNRTVYHVDENTCGALCYKVYPDWCRSYDYYFYNQTCSLSKFKMAQVGGLTTRQFQLDDTSFPLSHFELRSAERAMESQIVVHGTMIIGGNLTWGDALDLRVDVDTAFFGTLVTTDAVNLTFSRQLALNSASETMFAHHTSLSMVGGQSQLLMTYGARLTVPSTATLLLHIGGGQHHINGEVADGISMAVTDSAALYLYATNASTAGADVADSGVSMLRLTDLTIVSGAKIVMAGHLNNTIEADTVSLLDGAAILSNCLNLNIHTLLVIDNSSVVSASGMGYGKAAGPGAGSDHPLGASGGSHAGRGGPSKVDAIGAPYGQFQYPETAGSGGGRGFYHNSTGGAGGGVLHINCGGTVRLDGTLSADGEAGIAAGGGGAGGSVLVVAALLEGGGRISAAGGDGDFSGGAAAGGGGSGGYVAICGEDLQYTGEFDITSGYLHATYDVSGQEQASPGLLFLSVDETTFAVVTSTQPFADFVAHFEARSPLGDSELEAATGDSFRGSHVNYQYNAAIGCSIDIHIIGDAPILLIGGTVCLNRVIGSGHAPTLQVHSSSFDLLLASTVMSVQTVALEMFNVTFTSNPSFNLTNGGSLKLIDAGGHSEFTFADLTVGMGGSLIAANTTVAVSADAVHFLAGSTVYAGGELSLQSSDIVVSSATLRDWVLAENTSTAVVVVASESQATLRGDVSLLNCALRSEGQVAVDTAGVTVSPIVNDFTSSVSLNGSGVLVLSASATLAISVPLHVNAAVSLASSAVLRVSGGGTCSSPGSVNVALGAELSFVDGVFVLGLNCSINGTGTYRVQDTGVLRPPFSVASTTPNLHVLSGGKVEFRPSGVSQASSVYNAAILVEQDGYMLIANDTALRILQLGLDHGEIHLSATTSSIEVVGPASFFREGWVEGNGTISVLDSAVLDIAPSSSSALLTLLEVSIVNYGEIVTQNHSVNWVRSASLTNYGTMDFQGNQQWLHDEQLYAYLNLQHCTTALQGSPNIIMQNISAVECAKQCTHHFLYHTDEAALYFQVTSAFACKSFLYNEWSQTCQLQTVPVDTYASCLATNSSGNPYDWQLFVRSPKWSGVPVLRNAVGAKVISSIGSASSVHIAVLNDGAIEVREHSSLSVAGSFNQSMSGTLDVNGTFNVVQVGYSPIAGSMCGSGSVKLGTSPANVSTVVLAADITATHLSLELHGRARTANNMSVVAVKSLTIHGDLLIAENPLELRIEEALSLIGTSSIRSAWSVQTSETAAIDLPDRFTGTAACVSCHDAFITAATVSLEDVSSFDLAFAYIAANTINIASGAKISSTGRGYRIPDGVNVSVASATDNAGSHSAWAGTYSFLGSSGGSYGGHGGAGYSRLGDFDMFSSAVSYGDFSFASNWGTPGGVGVGSKGSSGGGALLIFADALVVDGTIESSGWSPQNSLAGGGSGGSVHICAATLSGAGRISATGGTGGVDEHHTIAQSGGGGGGRISLYYDDNSLFTGTLAAEGGLGFQRGSAGTIFTKSSRTAAAGGMLLVVNTLDGEPAETALSTIVNTVSPYGALTALSAAGGAHVIFKVPGTTVSVRELVGDGTGTLMFSTDTTLTPYGNQDSMSEAAMLVATGVNVVIANATLNATEVRLEANSQLRLTPAGRSLSSAPAEYVFQNIVVQSGGALVFDYHTIVLDSSTAPAIVNVNVSGTLNISAGGVIHCNEQGYQGSSAGFAVCYDAAVLNIYGHGGGCGEFGTAGGGGGAHGGTAGAGVSGSGGTSYGTIGKPTTFGSGGGGSYPHITGGNGGGVIHISADSLILDGTMSANGGVGTGAGAGGGAGGSIRVDTQTMSGVGSIQANGGAGLYSSLYVGGGGSGGRIAINCAQCSDGSDAALDPRTTFAGNVTAYGGSYQDTHEPDPSEQIPIFSALGFTNLDWAANGPNRAAAGTIFWRTGGNVRALIVRNSPPTTFTITYMRNNAGTQVTATATFTFTDAPTLYADSPDHFSGLYIEAHAQLQFQSGAAAQAHNVSGDSTSQITVAEGATLNLADNITFHSVHMTVAGGLTGAQQLTLKGASVLRLYPNATWSNSQGQQGSLPTSSPVYNAIDSETSILNTSVVIVDDTSGIEFFGGNVYSSKRAILLCDQLLLRSAGSYVTASNFGYSSTEPAASDAAAGFAPIHPAHQASGNISYGDGGWHAGRGGGAFYTYPAAGNAFYPVSYGAAGGSTAQTAGAAGGGAVRIIARNRVQIEGTVSANGQSCESLNTNGDVRRGSGGGAGGSVWIEVLAGDIDGSGLLEATGGSGCINFGGAGSGGRISVFTAVTDFSTFTGTVNVAAGIQANVVLFPYGGGPIAPAGGTIFVAGSDGLEGKLTALNNGAIGSDVFAFDDCSYGANIDRFPLATIYVADQNLVLNSACLTTLTQGILSAADTSVFPSGSVTASSGKVHIAGNSTVVVLTELALDNVHVQVDSSTIAFVDDLGMQNNALLKVSLLHSRLIGLPASAMSSAAAAPTVYLDSMTAPSTDSALMLSYISLKNLDLSTNSSVAFLSATLGGITESNVIVASNVTLAGSASITAAAVITNPELTWSLTGTLVAQYLHYGDHTSTDAAASGGGHAGRGTAGTNRGSAGGASRGDPLTPFGPGGPGGADVFAKILGGAGGGGLYFNVTDFFLLDGTIDVSGGSATLGSQAGGGAGGSIYIQAPLANVLGTGQLLARGGNGSIASTAALNGGAGSGGRVSIQACTDAFIGQIHAQGGLTVDLPPGLPHFVSTTVYQEYSNALDLSNIGGTGYRSMQSVVEGSSGTFFRAGVFDVSSSQAPADGAQSACAAQYASSPSAVYDLESIAVQGWSVDDLRTDTSALTAAMVSSLHLADASAIDSVVHVQTVITIPFQNDVASLNVAQIAIEDCSVKFDGIGEITGAKFNQSKCSAITCAGELGLTPSYPMVISNFTMNLTELCVVRPAPGADLHVINNGKLLINYGNLTDDFVRDSLELYDSTETMPPLTFGNIEIRNNAGIYGSRIIMGANSIKILQNSTLSADGLGMFGGYPGSPPTGGSGPGGGATGETGGDGGSHGGFGLSGLSGVSRAINEDQFIGSFGADIFVDDSSLDQGYPNGSTYGDLLYPIQYGGGGGAAYSPTGKGGRGGGAIKLAVVEDITIDAGSSLSADGQGVYGGGGAGAGGSIWIADANNDTVDIHGHIVGAGRLSAMGGHTCPLRNCSVSIDYPGGAGGGGRIRIDKTLERFDGTVNVLPGIGNDTLDVLMTKQMGTIVRVEAISTLVLSQLVGGDEVLDIVFTQTPLYVVQVITMTGTGTGSLNADDQIDAVVKGYWTLRYRSQGAETIKLSSQATAADVKAALLTLGVDDLSQISVTRKPSGGNGWTWSITFYHDVNRVVPIEVNGNRLWTTDYNAVVTCNILNPHTDALDGSGDLLTTDAPANFSAPQLRSMMSFNMDVLNDTAVGYWHNYRTFRVIPNHSTNNNYFRNLLYTLRLTSFVPVPTLLGRVTSTSYPYLLDEYQPNWKYPSSQPSNQPTSQPTGSPVPV